MDVYRDDTIDEEYYNNKDWYPVLEAMLRHRKRLEQESYEFDIS